MILAGDPWRKPRGEIGAMTRWYVLEVLGWPRDEKNRPVFPEIDAGDWTRRRAESMGLPHGAAKEFVKRRKGGGK